MENMNMKKRYWTMNLQVFAGDGGDDDPGDEGGDRRRKRSCKAAKTGKLNKRVSEGKTPSETRLFPVCGWFCGQRQKPKFKPSKIVAKRTENTRFSLEKRVFCGAATQI